VVVAIYAFAENAPCDPLAFFQTSFRQPQRVGSATQISLIRAKYNPQSDGYSNSFG
jgi:hypothetical protein